MIAFCISNFPTSSRVNPCSRITVRATSEMQTSLGSPKVVARALHRVVLPAEDGPTRYMAVIGLVEWDSFGEFMLKVLSLFLALDRQI